MRAARRATVLALVLLVLGASASLSGLAPTAAAQTGVSSPQFVVLRITSQTPAAVTASATTVRVSGELVNVGDREVRDLEVRLQRAPAVTTESGLREALRSPPESFDAVTRFVPAATVLAPGQRSAFTVTAQLAGTGDDGLATPGPGTYPLLVNVNGQPDFGNRAKLDEAAFLLPVLSLPADPATGSGSGSGTSTGTAAPAPRPVGTTVLWPLADTPRLLPAVGGVPTLADDDLATSFGRGGRLDTLLSAVETRTAPAADPTGSLDRALCLAVDPDLLVTAQAMVSGYQVSDGAGGVRAGTGGPAAASWLDRLRGVARDHCVQAVPWAQTDLDALTRAGLADLRGTATTGAEQTVAAVLGTPVTTGTTWPSGSTLAPATATALAAGGQPTALLSADAVSTADGAGLPVTTSTVGLGSGLSAVVVDPPVATALAATGSSGGDGSGVPDAQRVLRLQDAVGALSFAPLATARGADAADVPTTVVVAPPQRWAVSGDEPGAVLDALLRLYSAGLATAAPLADLVTAARAAPPTTGAAVAAAAPGSGTSDVPAAAVTRAAAVAATVDGFTAAATTDPQLGVTPDALVAPLRYGLLRATSTGGAPPALSVDAVADAETAMSDQVSLVAPSGSYTLASRTSPLLLTIRNQLPVAVAVKVRLSGPPGLDTGPVDTSLVPARSNLPLQVPTTVVRVGQFAVDASLVTTSGETLGTPTRLQVRSTAYGPATAAVVAAAAAVLLLLVARRLLHRLRGQPDRADEGRVPR
ncbi:hypothetical protein GCM10027047_05300 [Rhodococcus aerolatus]